MMQQPQYGTYDEEAGVTFTLKNENVQRNFIRKVLGILFAQFLLTAAFVAAGTFSTPYRHFILSNMWLCLPAAMVALVTCYALACFPKVARSVPGNYALLGVFTFCEAFAISFATAVQHPQVVFAAAVLTAAMTGGVMLYALTTKSDFTMMGGTLFLLGMTLAAAGVLGLIFPALWFQVALSLLGVLLGGVYLVYDVQLIAGNRDNRFSVDDYIMAALCIYIDIIRIFMELLKLMSLAQRNR